MISDVLSAAMEDIRDYERDYPDVYGWQPMSAKIDYVLAVMEGLRIELDTPQY